MAVHNLFKVAVILSSVITSTVAFGKCLKANQSDYPIFDITKYIEDIFHYNTSEARESFREALEADSSPTLYYASDYNRNILETLSETFVKVTSMITNAGSGNSATGNRDIILALRPLHFKSSVAEVDYPRVSDKTLHLINTTLAAIIIDWDVTRQCQFDVARNHSDEFVAEIRNGLAKLKNLKSLPLGFGFTEKECKYPYYLEAQPLPVDFGVVTIDLKAEVQFPESYQMLKDYVSQTWGKNYILDSSLKSVSSNMNLRINFHPHNRKYNEEFGFYRSLLREFAERWSMENGCKVIVNENKPGIVWEPKVSKVNLWEEVSSTAIPYLFEKFGSHTCMHLRLALIASKFDTFLLNWDAWNGILNTTENTFQPIFCKCGDIQTSSLPTPSNILLLVNITKTCDADSCDSLQDVLEQLVNKTEIHGMPVKSVIFSFPDNSEQVPSNVSKFLKNSLSGIRVGCFAEFGDLWGGVEKLSSTRSHGCPLAPLELAAVSIWEFILNFNLTSDDWSKEASFRSYTLKIQQRLFKVFEMVARLRRMEPGREIIVKLETRVTADNWSNNAGVLCDKIVSKVNLLLEAITTWARIHQVRVILKPAFGTPTEVGWWSELNSWQDRFVANNYPQNSNFGTDPCIPWNENTNEQVSFQEQNGSIAGLTVNMAVRKYSSQPACLNKRELEMMTLYALHVSTTLEILPRTGNLSETISDLETISEMISDLNFVKVLNLNNITRATLFINIPGGDLFNSTQALFNILNASQDAAGSLSTLTVGGIHISISSETELREKEEQVVAEMRDMTKVGVSVTDCDGYILSERYQSIQFIRHSSYIICESKKFLSQPSDKWSIQWLLGVHLAAKLNLLQVFPNLQTVILRQILVSDFAAKDRIFVVKKVVGNEMVTRYMRYMSHLNALRKAYNSSFFVPGFDQDYTNEDHQSKKFEAGWWNISSYSNLSDRSVYTEKQSNYFHNPSWRPILLEDVVPPTMATVPLAWLILILSVVSIGVVLALFFTVRRIIQLQRKVSSLLTEQEVSEFFEGTSSDDTTPLINAVEQGFLYQKFDHRFEISKAELNPDDRMIVGSGNFGVVYAATAKGIPVAVKVPHVNCSKETFRSMLFEVKILSHLGTHANVVEFVGCYTKEIRNGVIFIATKLCERGSLQSHLINDLRNRNASIDKITMPELVRFSMEIASGMEHISTKSVVHGDLSTRNVLLDAELTCKIADFGLSRKLYEHGEYVKQNQEPLPWRWLAYESLVDMEFTTKSDVWSYGVTLWEIFNLEMNKGRVPSHLGHTPYIGLSWTQGFAKELRKGLRLDSPEYANEHMYHKMRTCWNLDPATRPNFQELVEFFQQIPKQ